jgi:hypothetical protein
MRLRSGAVLAHTLLVTVADCKDVVGLRICLFVVYLTTLSVAQIILCRMINKK